jgi:hypothetical protein
LQKGKFCLRKTEQYMKFEEFKASMADELPPRDITSSLAALWYAGKGDWEQAHAIAQDVPTREGSWVHAYLHRVEGDQWNADYWYNRAGKTMPGVGLEQEWENIVKAML